MTKNVWTFCSYHETWQTYNENREPRWRASKKIFQNLQFCYKMSMFKAIIKSLVLSHPSSAWVWDSFCGVSLKSDQTLLGCSHMFCATIPMTDFSNRQIKGQKFCGWVSVLWLGCKVHPCSKETRK